MPHRNKEGIETVVTTYGKEQIAVRIGSDSTKPGWIAIGTGSGAETTGRIALITESDRNAITDTDITVARKVIFTSEWNSVEMSGIQLREFGVFNVGTASTGSLWNIEALGTAVVFDGTNELQTEVNWKVF